GVSPGSVDSARTHLRGGAEVPIARRITVLPILVAVTAFAGPAAAGSVSLGRSSPARMPDASTGREAAVTAVVVKSWGNCSSNSLIWDDLNANWSLYGPIPIVIDYSNPSLCGASFTLHDLEASEANVVILDDPAGGNRQFTPDEVAALKTYVSEGHNLVGTFLTFANPVGGTDN